MHTTCHVVMDDKYITSRLIASKATNHPLLHSANNRSIVYLACIVYRNFFGSNNSVVKERAQATPSTNKTPLSCRPRRVAQHLASRLPCLFPTTCTLQIPMFWHHMQYSTRLPVDAAISSVLAEWRISILALQLPVFGNMATRNTE